MYFRQHRDTIAGIFRELAPSSNLPNDFDLNLGCEECFSDEKLHEIPNHQCSGALILCRDYCNSKWYRVRSPKKICVPCRYMKSINGCKDGEKCRFAHNTMEEVLWKENFDLRIFQRLVQQRCNMVSTSHLSPGPSNTKDSQSRPNPNSNGKSPNSQSPFSKPPHQATNVASTPKPYTPPVIQEDGKKKIFHKKSSELLEKYDFDLVCSQCCERSSSVDESQDHDCKEDILIAKGKNSDDEWSVVRPLSNAPKYFVCPPHVEKGTCDYLNKCHYAHNDIELVFWKKGVDFHEFIASCCGMSVSSVASSVGTSNGNISDILDRTISSDCPTPRLFPLLNGYQFVGSNVISQPSVPQSPSGPNLVTRAQASPLLKHDPAMPSTHVGAQNYPMHSSNNEKPELMTVSNRLIQSPQPVPRKSKKAPVSKKVEFEKPERKKENKIVLSSSSAACHETDEDLSLFCTCCGISIGTLASWDEHIQSTEHKMKFIISRTAQWIYRAPGTEENLADLCSSVHQICESLPGYCHLPYNELEKIEWEERIQVTNVVKTVIDNPSFWEEICECLNKKLLNGEAESLFTAVPEDMNIVQSSSEYRKVSNEIPYKCEWSFLLTRPDCQERTWQAVFILPGYYSYFYFSSNNNTNNQLVHIEFEETSGYANLKVGFEGKKPGYYEQWMLLRSESTEIVRRFIVHLEASTALVNYDHIRDVHDLQKRVQATSQTWKKVEKFDDKCGNFQNDSLYFPLSEANMVTFVGDHHLLGSPTNSSQFLPHMHQLLNLEEQYQMKLLIHLCERMKLGFRANGVEIVNKIQTGHEMICPPGKGALFMRIKLPNGCDMYQELHDPRIYLLRRTVQMVWIKCIPCNGDSSNESFEFECPLVSLNSSVLSSDTAMAFPTQIVIILSRFFVNKLQLTLDSDKKDYRGVVDIFMYPGYGKRNRSPFESLHMAVAKQPHLSNGRPIVHPESRLAHNLPFKPRFTKKQIHNVEDKLNSKQKFVLEELLKKDYSQAFEVDMGPPPFVLRGCFGSGKTKTLGAFIRLCLKLDSDIRILVCTRSNSAADMYITRELQATSQERVDKRILRLFSKHRTSHRGSKVDENALFMPDGVTYVRPQLSHLKDKSYRVIIMTLNALSELLENDDPEGLRRGSTSFDYILVDEAAQILEAEAMIAITLATPRTRLVFAGDDMQQRPIIFSPHARQAGLSLTILDRLWYQYEKDGCPVRAHLNVVYRSHPLLVRFLGEAFYSECGKLECNSQATLNNQPPHTVPGFVMCHVYTGGGESICYSGKSGGLWNIGEAKAVVYCVRRCLLVCNQYNTDGSMPYREEDVCVISPFAAQVNLIRQELRKCGLRDIIVEHLNNVQGREFRVVILSPVLTRKQLSKNDDTLQKILNLNEDWQGMDFCHEPTLLNAAMSRAISILEVVGDAVGLSLYGSEACKNIWAKFVQYAEKYSKVNSTCPSQLCTLKWDKNMDNITNPDRWAKENPEVTSVENYFVCQWEEERQKIISY